MNRTDWVDIFVKLLLAGLSAVVLGVAGKTIEAIPKLAIYNGIKHAWEYLVWIVPISIPNALLSIGGWIIIAAVISLIILLMINIIKKHI
jgi:hypothetical protein